MTDRKRAANAANARRSTGPRSGAGKARSAQNARQHGLAVPVLLHPELCKEVNELAALIAEGGDLALEIAGEDERLKRYDRS
jgi:hypothetical protein